MNKLEYVNEIKISKKNFLKIIKHCKRKLNKQFLSNETKEQQSFGAIVGQIIDEKIFVTKVIPLRINHRFNEGISNKLNCLIREYGIPGELNIEKRAWVIDPNELSDILLNIKDNEIFFGTYHMHHDESWKGDFPKQLPTELDRVLSENSELFSFIVYIDKKNNKNTIRAFFEAKSENEIDIVIECNE